MTATPICLTCDRIAEVGVLCRACAQQVVPPEGLIADHVYSTVDPEDAVGWIVDGFGTAHALATKSTIGRSVDGPELVVLSGIVSREHARLEKTDDAWTVRDLGSHNGTFVEGNRVQSRAPVPPRALLRFGDLAFWFLSAVRYQPAEAASVVTVTAGGGMIRYAFTQGTTELCIVGGNDTGAGGSLLTRVAGTEPWTERGLAPLEFQLLRALAVRAHEEADSPSTVRGTVATRQLARDLPFQSKYAHEENVRQVVRRVRGVLAEVGADGALLAVPGRGYYLASQITVGR